MPSRGELVSHCGAEASQNNTSPVVTGDPAAVTVAVKTIGVLYGTLVEEMLSVVVVGVVAYAAPPANIAAKSSTNCSARFPVNDAMNFFAERGDFREVIRVP